MAARRFSITALAICAFAAGAIGMRFARHPASEQPTLPLAEHLIQITPHRIAMKQALRTLCMAPRTPQGPHSDAAEILVYANRAAIEYRREHPGDFDYPIGSKFVKEKFPSPAAKQPDMATIMERRAGNGDVSDWRFAIVSLPDKIELSMAGRVSCASCHQEYKDTGYVSDDSENALKQYLKVE
jgi:hypothetical protein